VQQIFNVLDGHGFGGVVYIPIFRVKIELVSQVLTLWEHNVVYRAS
jgi:hypothetical protein